MSGKLGAPQSNTYTVSEDAFPGYTLASNSCPSLVHALANIGTDYTCTLVNNDNPVSINALPETFAPILGTTGGTTTTVLGSDTLSGLPISNPALVAVTVTGATGGLTLNASNQIVVPSGLAPGNYTLTYQVCEIAVPGNCDTQTETVTVLGIDAVAETFPAVASATGGTTTTVLASDTLNGVPITNPALVTVTATGSTGGLTLNGSNQIVVPAGLAAGPYTLTYQICDVANPTFCDTVTETVTVSGILAVNDAPVAIPGAAGGATPTVLGNDTLNGVTATPATVTIAPGVAPAPAAGSITMDAATGIIIVVAGTTPGTYLYPYTICEVAQPANCSSAIATVVVGAPTGAALVTDISRGNAPGAAVTVSVITNDTDPLGVFNPATMQLVGTAGPGLPLVVAGQGTWSVNLANSTMTFTPLPGFTGNPTPVPYQIEDLAGNLIAPAPVIILYESAPVFVCSEVIGKVFEDPNFNGQQDDGEAGMPGVRIATVNGKIITTDEYGRYHVPCAMLPRDTGSNFLLKVDPRSLPSAFR